MPAAEPSPAAVSVQRLTDAAYRILKAQILSQAFAPGQRLRVDDLAARLGMSRTPVKDALNALAAEGLVDIVPRRGTFVAGLSAETIAEVFELRRALELLAAESLVARVTDEEIAELKELLAALDDSAQDDADEHMRRNMAFHRAFVRMAGNRKLLEVYESLNVHIQIARIHARWQNWQQRRPQEREEHQAILQALETRDAASLAAAVDAHIRRAKRSLVDDLQSIGSEKGGDGVYRTSARVLRVR
jgi:DNA-binding GntR family transcriptional regulator